MPRLRHIDLDPMNDRVTLWEQGTTDDERTHP